MRCNWCCVKNKRKAEKFTTPAELLQHKMLVHDYLGPKLIHANKIELKDEKILSLAAQGMSITAIAETVRKTRTTIAFRLARVLLKDIWIKNGHYQI